MRSLLFSFLLLCGLVSAAQTDHLVVAQVYGAGGNSGATYRNDYVVLFNPTNATVSLTGYSLQYASAGGSSWTKFDLSGSVLPGQYFLVSLAGGANGSALPTPDLSGTSINMSGTAGKIALAGATVLTGTCPTVGTYVDLVGFGSTASCFETAFAPAPSTTNAIFRTTVCSDNNNNATEFAAAAAAPVNSSTFNYCQAACAPTNAPTALSFGTVTTTSISGSFTAAANGTVAAVSYLVLASTSATLSAQPTDGVVYNAGDDLGNATVVVSDAVTSFTATGLIPATTYYFFVYSISATGCYKPVSLQGNTATQALPPCTPPATQASALVVNSTTASGINIGYTRGSGDAVLVVYRLGSAVDADPVNGTAYTTGTQLGSGNFVAYAGPAATASLAGLQANTVYHISVFEYSTATNCYKTPALTGSATTACGDPAPVTALTATAANAGASLTWAQPAGTVANGNCFQEVLILASTANITADASTYAAATANPAYAGGVQLVYRGAGTSATITGLTNGTTYYFRAYSRNGSQYTPLAFAPQVSVTPFDPASLTYTYLYGNLHAHSSYSDGNKADLTKTPFNDFEYARDAQCMDFLGMSEHNHTGAGMNKPDYTLGYNQANSANLLPGPTGNTLVTLWGMEWGVSSSGGGHVLIYGFDNQLIGWEANQYDIFVAKSDYTALWSVINNKPGAVAMLAHPGGNDYGNIVASYNQAADNAVVGMAVESGPALDNTADYNNYPSSLSFFTYYKNMLAKGYRLAPQMDQDNHYMNFGTVNRNRLVVLATEKTRNGVMDALRNMRYFASNDCNVQIDYKSGTAAMGSSVVKGGLPALNITVIDPDAGETVSSIELWGGPAGSGSAALIKTWNSTASVSFTSSDAGNVQANNTTWYYFAIVTQGDGNKMVTAPIWYSRSDVSLPVTLVNFDAAYQAATGRVVLSWNTSSERNASYFIVERSTDGRSFAEAGRVAAAGNATTWNRYAFTDPASFTGKAWYRLKMVDLDGSVRYSAVRLLTIERPVVYTVYPNPAKGQTWLSSTRSGTVQVRILDGRGQVYRQSAHQLVAGTPLRIDVSALATGMYFLQVDDGKELVVEKLYVSH